MSTSVPVLNYVDANGTPVCPTCGRAILPHHPAMRIDDCMIHAWCFTEAQAEDEPCEPSPANEASPPH